MLDQESDEENRDEQIEIIESDNLEHLDIDDDEGWQTDNEDDFQSDAFQTFKHHTNSVISCEFCPPNSNCVISGGQDDRAFLWDSTNLEIKLTCTGHEETVSCVSCSHDGKYIATADMNGLIQVWESASQNPVWKSETSSEIMWIRWHPQSHVLLCGTNTGDVWLWAVPSGNCKIFPTQGSGTDCGRFFPDGLRAIVGYADGSIKTLDLKNTTTNYHFKGANKHGGMVSSIDCYHDNVIAASGSQQDCTVKLLDTRGNKILTTLTCDKSTEDNGVESISFHPNQPTLVTGTLKGTIKVWDIGTQTEKLSISNEAGVVKLIWHPNSFLIYAAGLDGVVRRWDSRSGQLDASWKGHSSEILDLSLSFDGKMLVTASDDSTCCVFKT